MGTSVFVETPTDLSTALLSMGLQTPRPTIVLVGGAGNLSPSVMARLQPLFERGIVPLAERLGCYVVDGATDSGVMRMMGRVRNECDASFALIGVAAKRTVADPEAELLPPNTERLEPHHTHFILVPGHRWGDESPWIARVAAALAGHLRSVTILINGGDVALEDVRESVGAARPVVVVGGTGRLADEFAAVSERGTNGEFARMLASGLLHIGDAEDDPSDFAASVQRLLGGG